MARFGIGQPVRRTEDPRLLTGRGRYTDDLTLARQAWGVVLRSPHAHACVRAIDTAAARAAPRVLGVFTGPDLAADDIRPIPCRLPYKKRDGSPMVAPARPILATDRVRHVGEGVAFVVAESRAQAQAAAELIAVDYAPLPALACVHGATGAGAPALWDDAPDNIGFDWEAGDKAATDAAFAAAAHTVTLELTNNRLVANPLEPRSALAEYDAGSGRYTLLTPSQGSHRLQSTLAEEALGVPLDRVRVVTPEVGGGFGVKIYLYPEQVLVCWAARLLGRPVKWTADRTETFLADVHGRDCFTRAQAALDADGTLLAFRIETLSNLGAYVSMFRPFTATVGSNVILSGVYAVPAIHVVVRCVFTNTVPLDAYRGAGRPEAIYAVERLVDEAARAVGVDRARLRRRNTIPATALPYRTLLGLTLEAGDVGTVLEAAEARADWDGFPARRVAAEARCRLRGIGLASYIEACARGLDERAEIRVDHTGLVTLHIGTQSNGQGHETTFAQIVSDRLGLPLDAIRVVAGDTDVVAFGRGTGGSRSLVLGGSAALKAAARIVEKGRSIAAHLLEAAPADSEFAGGRFIIAGTDRALGFAEVAAAAYRPHDLPDGLSPGLNEIAHHTPPAPTHPNGCHVAEVEIDPETGTVEIVRYTVVDDFGTVVNPLLLAGQIHGGIAQGIGQALYEECVYDDSAQLLSGSFMDYCMPRADGVPAIDFHYDERWPCPNNPLGAKGCGEAGAVGAPPAVINAILDALSVRGVRHIDMPATPERVWRALRG